MQGEIMRIVCDHCSLPISGKVKKTSGNINLHPECLSGSLRNEHYDLVDGKFRDLENQAAGNGAQSKERKSLFAPKRRKIRKDRLATLRRRFLSRRLTAGPTRNSLVHGGWSK
jgi:hypothetical protein